MMDSNPDRLITFTSGLAYLHVTRLVHKSYTCIEERRQREPELKIFYRLLVKLTICLPIDCSHVYTSTCMCVCVHSRLWLSTYCYIARNLRERNQPVLNLVRSKILEETFHGLQSYSVSITVISIDTPTPTFCEEKSIVIIILPKIFPVQCVHAGQCTCMLVNNTHQSTVLRFETTIFLFLSSHICVGCWWLACTRSQLCQLQGFQPVLR